MIDNVNHPHHYEGSTSIECIDAMRLIFGDQSVVEFCLCNAFKYLWRHKNKNGKEDLEKASWYLTEAYKLNFASSINSDKLPMLIEQVNNAHRKYEDMEESECTETID